MTYKVSFALRAGAVAAALLFAAGSAAAAEASGWPAKWASSIAANTRLQEDLINGDYTAEERRNILAALNDHSDETRAARLTDPQRLPLQAFPGLDKYYGAPGYDEATSIPDRKDRILDILAKGNRVFGMYTISGRHQGTMWGWKGDGKPVEILAFFYRTYDREGRVAEVYYRAEELQLYVALGGKTTFSREGIATQRAEAPAPGTPYAAGQLWPAAPFPMSWPPKQWPIQAAYSPKLMAWLSSANWTDQEKQNLWRMLHQQTFVPPDYNQPTDFAVGPSCGTSCPRGRRGFQYIDELSGFHGYDAARSVRDRFVVADDIIAKGDRVIKVFRGCGHQTGYLYGFPADGHRVQFIEATGYRDVGMRVEELQFYVSMGGKLQFPGGPLVPVTPPAEVCP